MTSHTRPETVYLIDDDASVRRALARLLRVAGYDVVVCESAAVFLTLAALQRPFCIVADLSMPGLTGWDLQKLVKARQQDASIVFISGHGEAIVGRAVIADVLVLLAKPVDEATLLAAVGQGIELDRRRLLPNA